MTLKFIVSQKGQKQLLLNGYLYTKKSVNRSTITWRCVCYHTSVSCDVIVHTDSDKCNGNVIGSVPKHDHSADPSGIEAKRVRNKIRKRGKASDEPPGIVIGNVLGSVESPVIARLPQMVSLSREVQRIRKVAKIPFEEPRSRKDLKIPDEYCVTDKGENMLYYDSGPDKSRFLIFTTERNLQCLSECEQWASDGTFSSVPSVFKQLYTIHGLKNGKMLPLIYILLPNKSQETYINVLELLKSRVSSLQPRRIMIDFEPAFMNAMKSCFDDVEVAGCLFHFSQSVWRRVQSIGLQSLYNTNSRFALNVRMLLALSFVPVDDVGGAYNCLVKSPYYCDNEEHLQELLEYFERTWVGVPSRSGTRRLKPYFPIRMWNCYDAVRKDDIRSNNAVEGWHNSFNRKVRVCHASMAKFIDVIKCEQSITDTLIVQADTGLSITKRRRAYVELDERIKSIVKGYNSKKQLKYLHDIALILTM